MKFLIPDEKRKKIDRFYNNAWINKYKSKNDLTSITKDIGTLYSNSLLS